MIEERIARVVSVLRGVVGAPAGQHRDGEVDGLGVVDPLHLAKPSSGGMQGSEDLAAYGWCRSSL
jgi:hypothetical protein